MRADYTRATTELRIRLLCIKLFLVFCVFRISVIRHKKTNAIIPIYSKFYRMEIQSENRFLRRFRIFQLNKIIFVTDVFNFQLFADFVSFGFNMNKVLTQEYYLKLMNSTKFHLFLFCSARYYVRHKMYKIVAGYYVFLLETLWFENKGLLCKGQVLKDEYFWSRGTENLNSASTLIDPLKARNQSFYSLDLISPVVSSLYGAPLFQSLCVV